MANKGRKRKAGGRTPSGRLSRAQAAVEARGERNVVLAQPHRACLGETRRLDQRAENELGRLFLAGKITEAQCWAGERYRCLMHDFHAVLASPMTTGSPLASMVAPGVEEEPEPDGMAAERSEDEIERRDRVLGAHRKVMSTLIRASDSAAGRLPLLPVLDHIVLRDASADASQRELLRLALQYLVVLWRLDAGQDRRIRGSRTQRPSWPHEERVVDIRYA